jgi:hypothetical protein
MVPYIAALSILIVAVLFTVWKQKDCFTDSPSVKNSTLYDAICGLPRPTNGASQETKETKKAKKADETKEDKEDEVQPAPSMSFTKELEDRISKTIQTQLKDKMLVDRATQNLLEDTSCPYASYTNATAQGSEFTQAKPNPGPDMSEYIRKDSIPCWNCSLP